MSILHVIHLVNSNNSQSNIEEYIKSYRSRNSTQISHYFFLSGNRNLSKYTLIRAMAKDDSSMKICTDKFYCLPMVYKALESFLPEIKDANSYVMVVDDDDKYDFDNIANSVLEHNNAGVIAFNSDCEFIEGVKVPSPYGGSNELIISNTLDELIGNLPKHSELYIHRPFKVIKLTIASLYVSTVKRYKLHKKLKINLHEDYFFTTLCVMLSIKIRHPVISLPIVHATYVKYRDTMSSLDKSFDPLESALIKYNKFKSNTDLIHKYLSDIAKEFDLYKSNKYTLLEYLVYFDRSCGIQKSFKHSVSRCNNDT